MQSIHRCVPELMFRLSNVTSGNGVGIRPYNPSMRFEAMDDIVPITPFDEILLSLISLVAAALASWTLADKPNCPLGPATAAATAVIGDALTGDDAVTGDDVTPGTVGATLTGTETEAEESTASFV